MTVRTPTPLAAAVGLAAEAAEQLRRLPTLLIELPPTVTRQLEAVRQTARERYDELALHGRDVLASAHAAAPAPEVAVPDGFGAPSLAEPAAEPAPEPGTQPPAPVPPLGRTEPVEIPDDVLEDVAQLAPGGELSHADLPLPDFDHQTLPQLRGRLRTLALPELIQLRDYEQAHASRLPVLTLLDNRIAKLTEPGPGR
jgi:hypothetical protein